jgi:hypothetical protein
MAAVFSEAFLGVDEGQFIFFFFFFLVLGLLLKVVEDGVEVLFGLGLVVEAVLRGSEALFGIAEDPVLFLGVQRLRLRCRTNHRLNGDLDWVVLCRGRKPTKVRVL